VYIYNPEQKDEIQRQIAKMLATGITQPSTNPFPSHLLLVAKKDLSWRLRTNFGASKCNHSQEQKFPIPTVEELSDE
jgi:hypothetical protein